MRALAKGLPACAALALVTCFSAVASAGEGEPAPEPERVVPATCDVLGPRNAISTQPLALAARGVGLSYERLLGPPTFSVAALVGGRSAALGDYSSATLSGGVEGRAWARVGNVGNRGCGFIAMSGLYVSWRMTVGYTRLSDRTTDDFVGSSLALSSMLGVGWRFVAWRLLEVTPSIAAGLRSDVDPQSGLGTSVRGALAFGLSVGWMF